MNWFLTIATPCTCTTARGLVNNDDVHVPLHVDWLIMMMYTYHCTWAGFNNVPPYLWVCCVYRRDWEHFLSCVIFYSVLCLLHSCEVVNCWLYTVCVMCLMEQKHHVNLCHFVHLSEH